jgi:photosystem II stability/assembly factor-like uncharacterized protein
VRRSERAVADRGTLLFVDAGAHAARRTSIEASASSVALADGAIIVATRRGTLLRSTDRGKTASSLGSWGSGAAPVSLATTPGRLWVLSNGILWSSAASTDALEERSSEARSPIASATPPRHDATGTPARGAATLPPAAAARDGVLRIAASEGVVVALATTPAGPQLDRLRGDDEGSPSIALAGAARRAAESDDSKLAATAGGRSIAMSGGGSLCISRDGGDTFRVIGGLPPIVALAFAGEHADAPVLALVARSGEHRAQLVHVPARSTPTIVAEIGASSDAAPDDDPTLLGGAAIGWDSSREVAWVACRTGLIAIARQRKH